jgi:hypothetical protein
MYLNNSKYLLHHVIPYDWTNVKGFHFF